MVISAYVSYILLSSNYKYKLEKMSENTTSLTYFKKISYKVRNPTNYISYTVYMTILTTKLTESKLFSPI